jgi:hypothetical protein
MCKCSSFLSVLDVVVFCMLAIPIGMWQYLLIVLIFSFLTANDVECLFMCPFAIFFSEIFVHIFVYGFFKLLGVGGSLYVLNTNPLLGVWFDSMFFQSVSCLSSLFTGNFVEQKALIQIRSSLLIFPFMDSFCGQEILEFCYLILFPSILCSINYFSAISVSIFFLNNAGAEICSVTSGLEFIMCIHTHTYSHILKWLPSSFFCLKTMMFTSPGCQMQCKKLCFKTKWKPDMPRRFLVSLSKLKIFWQNYSFPSHILLPNPKNKCVISFKYTFESLFLHFK